MDKNFKVRVTAGATLFIIAVVAMYAFDGTPFRILFGLFSLIAAMELLSFLKKSHSFDLALLLIFELGFLFYGSLFIAEIDAAHVWYIILGVAGYDIFAYLFGRKFGGKIFGKKRPFPKISKNKTWEGTLFGLFTSIILVCILMAVRGAFATDWMYLLCGPLAICGDLFESYLKRQFGVKDSNEIVIKNKLFEKLEILVGGSDGHGGYLDRIDSIAFTGTVLLIISAII